MNTAGHAAHLELDVATGEWKASYQGKILARSANRKYIIDTIEKGMNKQAKACGVTHCKELHSGNVGELLQFHGMAMPAKPEFSIAERFDFLENLTRMAIEDTAHAVLVTGEGGLGKTYTIVNECNLAGLTFTTQFQPPPEKKKDKKGAAAANDAEVDESESEDDEDEEEIVWQNPGQVHIVKGYSSAKGLYRTLFENNGKLIIFDDCDSIQKDTNAVNILKGALDSSDERWISWNAEAGRGLAKMPMSFRFTGRVIFISNWSMHRIDEALKTRCLKVDLSMTQAEKIERMDYIIHRDVFMPHIQLEIKEDAVRFLDENKDVAATLSLRSLLDTIKFRNKNMPNWERQALYSLVA